MAVSNELTKPDSEEEFEEMCHALYRRMWNDSSCNRVGGPGQSQFGIDIIGYDGKTTVGIQCKHYNKKSFTLSTVTEDVARADAADLGIGHMLFATTAANKARLVLDVRKLSEQRRQEGKFTISIDFWEEISGHLRIHPDVARIYIRNFPGTQLSEIQETVEAHQRLYIEDRDVTEHFQTQVLDSQKSLAEKLATLAASINRDATPASMGDEADPRVVASLDLIRDRVRDGKCNDAKAMLDALGDPAQFKDTFSRFRWHTNRAAIALLEGNYEEAASGFLNAFDLAPEHEKAHINRTHAYVLLKDISNAESACKAGLEQFPTSAPLWALKLNIRLIQGDAEPDRGLPQELRETSDLLFTLAHIAETRGDSKNAIQLLQRCLDTDPNSFDAKRAYLAAALIWADADPVLAFHGQLTGSQKFALEDAVKRMEPLEQVLPGIQSENISLEVTSNVAYALILLGQLERGRLIAISSLRRHPLSEGLLRIRLNELEEHQDIAGIRALTDQKLSELPHGVLGTLAEISANHGQLEWHSKVMASAEVSGMELEKLDDLRTLSIHAQWVAGAHQESINAAEAFMSSHPEQQLPRIILGNMLLRLGRRDEALHRAEECAQHLKENASSLEVLHLADLYYRLGQHQEAGLLYAKLVITPSNDEFTRKWLICLVESDQRRLAQEVIEQLPSSVRSTPTFIRIEANLARRAGDWRRMRDLLVSELARVPDDSRVAIGYVGALHRLGEKEQLEAYLASAPIFKNAHPEDEFDFAKYQALYDYTELAVQRLYRLYRAHPENSQIAGYYLGQILIGKPIDILDPPSSVMRGTVVHLKTSSDTRVIAIDFENVSGLESWPELVSPDAQIAKVLLGKSTGEEVIIPGTFTGDSAAEIIALESVFAFAANKAQALIASAAAPAGPLWSVKIVKDDGELNIEPLLEAARQRKAQVQRAFDSYRQHRFPLSMLAHAVGSNPVTLISEWPYKEATLFVGIGTHEERSAAIEILKSENKRYVLDLLTVSELVRRKAFEAAVRVLGTPLVPETLREHLLVLQQSADNPRGSATLSENNQQLRLIETPDAYYDRQVGHLQEMISCIDSYCEVVPTYGPKDVSSFHRALAQALDGDTLDSLYLAAERGAVLVSEDGALRLLSLEAGVQFSIGIQPVLMDALENGYISRDHYANIIIAKLSEGHDFVSIGSEDLFCIAKRSPSRVADGVRLALETFRKPTLDIVSGVRVACEFLRHAVGKLQPATLAAYGKLVLDVLQHERPEIADAIHRAVATALRHADQRTRKLTARERKLFAPLLAAPARPVFSPQLTPIAYAIRSIFPEKGYRNR